MTMETWHSIALDLWTKLIWFGWPANKNSASAEHASPEDILRIGSQSMGGILRFTYWRLEHGKSNDDYPTYPKLCNFFPVAQAPDVELTISYLNLLQAFVADRLEHIKTVHQGSSQLLNSSWPDGLMAKPYTMKAMIQSS